MKEEELDWKAFQKNMGFSDDELEIFRSDPRRANAALRMKGKAREKVQSKFLVIEVVSSEGCRAQMKVGDRLFFRRTSELDLKRSDPWCILAMANLDIMAGVCHNRWANDLGLDDLKFDHLSCVDCGVRNGGWGRVTMKAYVKDESEL